jgi:hypothetical protein
MAKEVERHMYCATIQLVPAYYPKILLVYDAKRTSEMLASDLHDRDCKVNYYRTKGYNDADR